MYPDTILTVYFFYVPSFTPEHWTAHTPQKHILCPFDTSVAVICFAPKASFLVQQEMICIIFNFHFIISLLMLEMIFVF